MTEQIKLESICPSCGKTDKLLWPDGCKNTWHMEGRVAMSEQVNVPDDLKTWYEVACDGIEFKPGHTAIKALIERIAALEMHRINATLAEKKDCERALVALAGAGICTPEETYGTNSSWAIADLCRAVAALRKQVERLSAPVTDVEWACANYQQGFSTGIVSTKEGESTVMNWQQFTTRELINALIAARKGAA